MIEDRSKIISKAKKLKELADRGVGGEQLNAKEMFDKYMVKHNITLEELNNCSSNYEYSNMSEEDFLKEMMREIIPASIGLIFSTIFNKNTDYSKKIFQSATNKFLLAMEERYKNMTKKK